MNHAKDLTKEPPRSPRDRVGGYVLLGRMADKGRADLAGTAGGYHFNCPLDNMLFHFKGVSAAEVRPLLESGAGDEEIAKWLDTHGTAKTPEEIKAWSDAQEKISYYNDPEKRDWFIEVCNEAGVDPSKATLFDYLEADDRVSFPGK
jgi:hypothetical protein